MKKIKFQTVFQAVVRCYDASPSDKLPVFSDFPEDIFDSNEQLDVAALMHFAALSGNNYLMSITNRIIVYVNIIKSRDFESELDVKYNWGLVADSILLIPGNEVIATIGSQGFISIPIYKFDAVIDDFEFIRVHIWDKSLAEFIDQEKRKHFSIHSHKFDAQSWVICGEVVNDRFLVNIDENWAAQSLFSIEYDKSVNNLNKHKSIAKSMGLFVRVKQVSHELYLPYGSYKIKAGDYHESDAKQEDTTSATFFVFTAKYGLVDKSYVVGSSDISISEINRTSSVDAVDLVHKVNAQISRL